VGQNLLYGELQRLILLRHESIAVNDFKDFRRGVACIGACVFVHWDCYFSFYFYIEKPLGGVGFTASGLAISRGVWTQGGVRFHPLFQSV